MTVDLADPAAALACTSWCSW